MRWLLLSMILSCPVFACVAPFAGYEIESSVTLCNDVYYLDEGISITGSNVLVDCAGAILKGKYADAGIKIAYVENVTVKNCRILNYATGLLAIDAKRIFFTDNHLIRNRIGTSLFLVEDSAIYNFDVSLVSPVFIEASSNNILSSSNRFLFGPFCRHNYCNRPRSIVELVQLPKNNEQEFKSWFLNSLADGQMFY